MSLLQELIVIDPQSATPIYLQISDAVAKHIREGRLRKWLRLPGSREMAELLGVNRTDPRLAPICYGFMGAPVEFIRAATNLRKSVDTQVDSLIEVAIAQLYEDGTIERHVKKSVKLCRERRDSWCSLQASLPAGEVEFSVPEGGMSVWRRW